MAIPTNTQPVKRKYFPGSNKENSLFSGFESGGQDTTVGSQVTSNIQGMLTGSAFDDTRTQGRETLQRAAQNLRAQSGTANASALGQGKANRVQGQVEQSIFQGLADTELGLGIEEQAMKERGIGLATDIGKAQQDVVTARRGQDISLTQSREGNVSTEKIATQGIALDERRLAESARQFNISTQQAADQFKQSLKFDYSQLSQADKQFLSTLGLDQAKFEEAKSQFQRGLEQEGRLTMAQLNVQEKQIAEGARQFNSQLEFNESELAANLSEAEKNRVWQAVQNDKQAQNALTISTMQNDTERWKTEQTSILTQAGWDFQSAQNILDRTLQETMQNKEIALQREIEQGRITEAQAARLQQAEQFTNELDWQKEATRLGLDADEAARIWQTKERIGSQAFTATESNLNRQLEREIQDGNISIQEQQLAQQASQFIDEMEWQKEAKNLDLSDADAQRIWQSAEAAKDHVFQADMQQLQNEFTAKGWNFQALMSSVDSLPEEQVADLLSQVAVNSGISYTATNADGSVKRDAAENPITVPGFKTYASTPAEGNEAISKLSTGQTLTTADVSAINSQFNTLVKNGQAISDTGVESLNVAQWTKSGWNRWAITEDAKNWVSANQGKIYKASNGRLYTVEGISESSKRLSTGAIIFKDAITGGEVRLTRGNGFPEAS